jgi:hypothetical protein
LELIGWNTGQDTGYAEIVSVSLNDYRESGFEEVTIVTVRLQIAYDSHSP